MSRRFSEADRLAARKKLDAALADQDDLPASTLPDAERQERAITRAIALTELRRTEEGLATLESVMDSEQVQIAVFYFAGEYALELRDPHKALEYFSKAIATSIEREDAYYLNICYLLRAYLLIDNGDFVSAQRDLDLIDNEDCCVTWIPNIPRVARNDLMHLVRLKLADAQEH